MGYKALFIFVEGPDDRRFFETIIKPLFERQYDLVKISLHSNLKKEKIKNWLRSLKSMKANYIFVKDINNAPCVTAKKQSIIKKYKTIDKERIIVVIKEIESWYLAGLTEHVLKKFKISPFNTTDKVDKEQFNRLIPQKFDSRIDFMIETLKNFSIDIAMQKNKSFRYFIKKYDLLT